MPWYLDDLLNIVNYNIDPMVDRIHPKELQLKKTNTSVYETTDTWPNRGIALKPSSEIQLGA